MLLQYCKSFQYFWLSEILSQSLRQVTNSYTGQTEVYLWNLGSVFPHSHTLSNNAMFPCLAATCQTVWSVSHLDINNSTFNSSMARFFVANSCRCCHNSVLPFFAATCQAVRSESFLANKNLLLLSSVVSTSLAHSHNISSTSNLSLYAAIYQTVLPQLSV